VTQTVSNKTYEIYFHTDYGSLMNEDDLDL